MRLPRFQEKASRPTTSELSSTVSSKTKRCSNSYMKLSSHQHLPQPVKSLRVQWRRAKCRIMSICKAGQSIEPWCSTSQILTKVSSAQSLLAQRDQRGMNNRGVEERILHLQRAPSSRMQRKRLMTSTSSM